MSQLSIKQVVNSVYNSNSYILSHQTSEGLEVWILMWGMLIGLLMRCLKVQ